nr:hypothetical protein [Lachnospiraceae bacterium]
NLSTLSSYVNVTNGYKIVQPYGSDLGYVYMQMSGDKANEYYEKYYKNNKERLNNYFMVYAGSGKIELPAGSNISADGNFLSALKSDSSVVSDNVIYNTDSQLYRANLQTGPDAGQAVAIHDDYTTKKDNLCAKLIKQGVTPTEFANKLFDNLVLRNDIISLINLNSSDPLYGGANKYSFIAHNDTDGHDYKAVFAKYDSGTPFDYNDTDIRVLVVVGDVEINADFTGLLIASGTVTINGGHTITSIVNVSDDNQMQALKDCLQKKQSLMYLNTVSAGSLPHAEERSALQYFRDGSGYDLDGLQKNGSSTVSKNSVEFTELVKFNNWIKK